jgi:phosphoribosylformylglycinamidine cyclo-ligase
MSENRPVTYRDAGVDVKAGEQFVDSIKGAVKRTHNVHVLANIGGFGGLFRADFASMKDPVLVSSVDGVGTKLMVAFKTGVHDTIGQCLVNHCVNDIAVCGADPLFFLDYFATGKLKLDVAKKVIEGFSKACIENGCALIGGETAEMPDMYKENEYDVSGTIVGVVDRENLITGSKVKKGDVLIGFPSTGLHTNGYSLARKVLFSRFDVHHFSPELGMTVGEALLKVHKSYLPVIRALRTVPGVNAFSHITGGGIEGNTKRVVPDGLTLDVDYGSWERPALFQLIQRIGNVPEDDMRITFNLGIGLIALVSPDAVAGVQHWAAANNEPCFTIGKVV